MKNLKLLTTGLMLCALVAFVSTGCTKTNIGEQPEEETMIEQQAMEENAEIEGEKKAEQKDAEIEETEVSVEESTENEPEEVSQAQQQEQLAEQKAD